MTPVVLIFGQSNAQLFRKPFIETLSEDGGDDVLVLETAIGGAPLTPESALWNITVGDGDDTPGRAYTEMLAEIDELLDSQPDAYIAAAIWAQGESDTYVGGNVDYYNPAKDLFEATFDYIGEDVPTFVLSLSDYQFQTNTEGRDAINTQMQYLAYDMPNVNYIDRDAVMQAAGMSQDEAMRDGLHFNNVAHELFAEEILAQAEMREAIGLSIDDPIALEAEEEPEPEPVVIEEPIAEQEPEQVLEEDAEEDMPAETTVVIEEPVAEQEPEQVLEEDAEEDTPAEIETEPKDVHMQAGSEIANVTQEISETDESTPTIEDSDTSDVEESGAMSGVILGLSALGAVLGSFFLPLIALAGLLGMSKGKGAADKSSEEQAEAEASQEDVLGISLEQVVPVTEIVSEDVLDPLETNDPDILLL